MISSITRLISARAYERRRRRRRRSISPRSDTPSAPLPQVCACAPGKSEHLGEVVGVGRLDVKVELPLSDVRSVVVRRGRSAADQGARREWNLKDASSSMLGGLTGEWPARSFRGL